MRIVQASSITALRDEPTPSQLYGGTQYDALSVQAETSRMELGTYVPYIPQ